MLYNNENKGKTVQSNNKNNCWDNVMGENMERQIGICISFFFLQSY